MLEKDGRTPDVFILMQVIRCYLHAGDIDRGLKVFEDYMNANKTPMVELYAAELVKTIFRYAKHLNFRCCTVCTVVLSNHQKNNKHLRQNQKLQFQIYTSDKRIKQVVHHANKLNEAISAARGVPITRAHITVEGYYDAPI